MPVLSEFQITRPKHIMTQEETLDWLARAHALAAQDEGLYSSIKEKLLQIGLGPQKIQKRGTVLSDFTHQNWDEMQIYPVRRLPEGACLGIRMKCFADETTRFFEELYPTRESLPEHLIHVTCTGYVAPSGAQKVVGKRAAKTEITHAYHMGCYGAIPAVRMGVGYQKPVDIVHTELCSLHINPLLHTTEQLVVQSLFADGIIKYSIKQTGPGLKILKLQEEVIPDTSDDMSWICEKWGFKMKLSRDVPVLIARALPAFTERLVQGDWKKAIFAIHPGGPKIVEQVAKVLQLEPGQVKHTQEILQNYGNMSSATLPHVWEAVLKEAAPGTKVVSLAYGPGLTLCGGLFECVS
jgi:predicted naringenin-chalcone synthase